MCACIASNNASYEVQLTRFVHKIMDARVFLLPNGPEKKKFDK